MRRAFLLAVTAACSVSFSSADRPQTTLPAQSLFAQASKQSGCEIFYALQPIDANLLTLLGTPAIPTNPNLLTSSEYIQQRDWDFPSKVTPWSERPQPEEIAHRREELTGAGAGSESAKANKNAAIPVWTLWTYGLEPFSARDWNELQKWFAKEGPKKISGLCVDSQKADHILAVGVIVLGSPGPVDSTSARIQYGQTVPPPDANTGMTAASPGVSAHRAPQELSGVSDSARPGTHTCVYLFRTRSAGGPRMETPDDYYCRSSDDEPRAAVSAMLRQITKPAAN
jgi:hypothetical protein